MLSQGPSIGGMESIYLVAIIAGVAVLLLIFIGIAVIYYLHTKLEDQVHHADGKVIENGMFVSIPIGIYDNPDDSKMTFPNLPVERDAQKLKDLAIFFQYKFLTIHRKFKWTEDEVIDFMKNKVGPAFFDESGNPKYDGLIVSFSGHGVRNHIVTSDGKLIDRTSLHRIISNKYPKIREFPRIFLFDACDGAGKRRDVVNGLERVESDSEAIDELEKAAIERAAVEMAVATEHDIVKDTDLQDVQDGNEWTTNNKNPDYNLITVHASNAGFVAKMHGDEDVGSYLSYFFVKELKQNVIDGNKKTLGQIMDFIEEELHDSGKQLIRTEFFTGTRSLKIERRVRG